MQVFDDRFQVESGSNFILVSFMQVVYDRFQAESGWNFILTLLVNGHQKPA